MHNGGKFTSNAFKLFLKDIGITPNYTIPATPELNGTAERMHCILYDKCRALLFDSNLPLFLRPEALKTACYLYNCTSNSEKIPVEIWFNQKPNVKNLQIYGCAAYIHITDTNQTKLEPKVKKGYLNTMRD